MIGAPGGSDHPYNLTISVNASNLFNRTNAEKRGRLTTAWPPAYGSRAQPKGGLATWISTVSAER